MRLRRLASYLVLALAVCGTGCNSIQSDAVRQLIDAEAEKIALAEEKMPILESSTEQTISAFKQTLKDFDASASVLQKQEAVHSLVFSSNDNLDNKTGVDAHAVTYLIGKLYLERQAGLDRAVKEQYERDFEALREIVGSLAGSWSEVKKLHGKVVAYSRKSAFASVDADFVSAVIAEIPGGSEKIGAVLKRSKEVNEALKKVLEVDLLQSDELTRSHSAMNDLIDLLERIEN